MTVLDCTNCNLLQYKLCVCYNKERQCNNEISYGVKDYLTSYLTRFWKA